MQNDRLIKISIGESRNSLNWRQTDLMWSDFVGRLRNPLRTPEKFDEYIHMPKSQQGTLKDVGGFVGGTLNGTRRKASAVTGRDLVTLDMDNIATGETDNVVRRVGSLGIAYAIYSTRSHAPYRPRLRIILPLDRTVSADEYEPIARRMAAIIGIELCDPTTFEASRLMYWPSCSSDSQYVFATDDKPFTSADGILGQYENWRDVRLWPTVPGKELQAKIALSKQADPTTKPGIVGAFCRVYDIKGALDKYLPNAYAETDHEDRLTYAGGTTVAGAVLYDGGKFLYSHHATDPCCDQLVNAFDLVRIHVFSDRDKGVKPETPINKLPSYQAMKHMAMEDQGVLVELNRTQAEEVKNIFHDMGASPEPAAAAQQGESQQDADVNWVLTAKLEMDTNTGRPKKTMDNIIRILNYDPELKGKVAIDEFSTRGLALGKLPWSTVADKRLWTDTDDAGINWYLEARFGITGRDKISGALMLVSEQHHFNDVKDYLDSLVWDGIPRLATVLTDYLGAADNAYTRAVAQKSFSAAVARVETPGCKYDYVPVFVGPQGIGKTTFLRTLGKDWYSDSLQSFKGKEAAEMIQGIWINEIGEMTGYNKSEDDVIKQFLSRCDDVYRQPYGRHTGRYPRKGVFFGTCNNHDFLKDPTGSRRFWPVDVGVRMPQKNIWKELPGEVDQLWAEAVQLWKNGEPLYMDTPELDMMAKQAQAQHREDSVKEGLIQDFVEKEIPLNYNAMSLTARRMYWAGNVADEDVETCPREKVCALEVWCECFGGDPKNLRRSDAAEINQILSTTPGWVRMKSPRRYGYCGNQRGFERIKL